MSSDAPTTHRPRETSRSGSRIGRPLPRVFDGLIRFLARWLGPWSGLVVTVAIGLLIVVPLVAAFREIWEGLQSVTDGAQFDAPVHAWAMTIRQPWETAIAAGATYAAGRVGMPIVTIVLATVLSVAARSWRPWVLLLITGLGSLLLTSVSKSMIGRVRPPADGMLPPLESSPSFPSGHTLNSTAVMLVVAYCAWMAIDRLALRIVVVSVCVLVPLVVGFSRIYLGQHWFTDVVAALALGAGWAGAVIMGHRVFLALREERHAREAEAEPVTRTP